jgi:tRNA G18 (ribose-2'-O)-methylase SpoU
MRWKRSYFIQKFVLKLKRKITKTAEQIEINKDVFQNWRIEILPKVSMKTKSKLSDLVLSDNPLILVAEAPEKPGNIGALLRTDAANLDAVIIANPKVIYTILILFVPVSAVCLPTKLRLGQPMKSLLF